MHLYTPKDFQKMRRAGRLAAEVLDYITPFVKPGVSTEKLNQLCHDFIVKNDAVPAPLNYKGYPKAICTSVNEVICHGIPSENHILIEGDIVNIDITVIKKGYYGDTSRTFAVGKISPKAKKLVDTTYECLKRAIQVCKPGNSLAYIGQVIETLAESNGYSVVREFCGHGIGTVFHDYPNILHYYDSELEQVKMKPGMIFTIEPMINEGTWKAETSKTDGWTARTADGKLSAQFEHTIGINEEGCEVFTRSEKFDTF